MTKAKFIVRIWILTLIFFVMIFQFLGNSIYSRDAQETPQTTLPSMSDESQDTSPLLHHPYFVMGSKWSSFSESSQVTLFSHGSLDHLIAMDQLAERWLGPLSISIYTPGVDYHLANVYVNYLIDCHPDFVSRMAIHFAIPKALPPEPLSGPLHFPSGECPNNDVVVKTLLSFRTKSVAAFFDDIPYPHNILRNLASRAIRTNYMMMADMELIPSEHIFTQLEEFLNQTKQKDCFNCAYIIPQFEKNSTIEYLPRTKTDLIKMVDSTTASLLYENAYKPFQYCVQGSRWLKVPDSHKMEIAFPVNYTALCEPIVVVRSTAPGYINEMRGFGYNRLSQIMHLYFLGYSFQMLNPPFFLHCGRKPRLPSMPSKKLLDEGRNIPHMKNFINHLTQSHNRDACEVLNSIAIYQAIAPISKFCSLVKKV